MLASDSAESQILEQEQFIALVFESFSVALCFALFLVLSADVYIKYISKSTATNKIGDTDVIPLFFHFLNEAVRKKLS